jgi:hypothetical protein
VGRGSVVATGWAVRGSNAGEGEIIHIHPNRPWAPPSLLYSEYRMILAWGREEALITQRPLAPRLKKEYSSIFTPLLCLHARLLGELFVTFTLLKVIDMVLMLIFSNEKLVECTLSVPHVTLPCGKYRLWRTFLSISVYLNKHYASYSSSLIANSPKCLYVYWQYLHNAHGPGLCNSRITPRPALPLSIFVISTCLNPFWFTNQ